MVSTRTRDGRPPLLGGLLLGGASRRMGEPKAWLDWQGATFAERIVAALEEVVERVYLLGEAGPVPPALERLPRLADLPGVSGPLAGMLAAFAAQPSAAWLFASCDQPRLHPATLRWLMSERRSDRCAILPQLAPPRLEPFPGLFEPASRASLAGLAAAGREDPRAASLQRLRAAPGVALLAVPPELATTLRGANTPEELAALRREL